MRGSSADTLVQADLWGHQSHGVLRLPWYVGAAARRRLRPRRRRRSCSSMPARSRCMDGGDGDGPGADRPAPCEDAIRRAQGARHRRGRRCATPTTSARRMYFTPHGGARRGASAFLTTNASPAMAPWGGRKKTVGTNPWSWAAPAGTHAPMVLDIANTGVARGKIYLAKQKGEPIPEGWALDRGRRADHRSRRRRSPASSCRWPATRATRSPP